VRVRPALFCFVGGLFHTLHDSILRVTLSIPSLFALQNILSASLNQGLARLPATACLDR